MSIGNHVSQLFVDVVVAVAGFFNALAYSFIDAMPAPSDFSAVADEG
jgi:hypothetical protein